MEQIPIYSAVQRCSNTALQSTDTKYVKQFIHLLLALSSINYTLLMHCAINLQQWEFHSTLHLSPIFNYSIFPQKLLDHSFSVAKLISLYCSHSGHKEQLIFPVSLFIPFF